MSGNSVKVVILGDSGVGKTSLIQRYISGRSDIQNSTLGAVFVKLEHHFKNKDGKHFHLPIQFWDTAGQERYRALIPMYVRDADYVILAFDLNNMVSFLHLYDWFSFGRDSMKSPKFVLVGCKKDLKQRVYDEEVDGFMQKYIPDSKYFKCSSLDGENIKELFLHIKLDLESVGENKILLNSFNSNTSNNILLDDYDNLFSGNSYVELTGVRKKCCF